MINLEKNDTMRGIMGMKKKPSKARTVDNHYRTSMDEYELICRTAYDQEMSVAEYTRSRIVPKKMEEKLLALRSSQRKASIPDEYFLHPSAKSASDKR